MPSLSRRHNGGTLIEVLIALAILLIILVAILQFMDDVDQAWKSGATDPFAEAQDAFETVARNLAAATLNPYEDYADAGGSFRTNTIFVPDHLARRSDLDFVYGPASGPNGLLTTSGRITSGCSVFFVAPNGYAQGSNYTSADHLLNAMGYFIEFSDDDTTPVFLTQNHSWRWRLKQVLQPSESLQIFATTDSSSWIQPLVPAGVVVPVLAENVVLLIVLPERAVGDAGPSLAPMYQYDSRDTGNRLTLHQLPPRLRLALVAIDPISAQRLAAQNGANPPSLINSGLFVDSDRLDADLASLDSSLSTKKIGHCIFQREIQLPASNWSNTPSP